MSLSALEAFWAEAFPGIDPIAHELRSQFPERWVRFHSFPDSKRYPESELEYATVLERHNAVLSAIADEGNELFLVTAAYSTSEDGGNVDRSEVLIEADGGASHWRTLELDDDSDDERTFVHFFASRWLWRPGVFDPMLRLVADNDVADVMVVDASSSGRLYHPYDGGADVILEAVEARDELKRRFRDWLSKRRDGL